MIDDFGVFMTTIMKDDETKTPKQRVVENEFIADMEDLLKKAKSRMSRSLLCMNDVNRTKSHRQKREDSTPDGLGIDLINTSITATDVVNKTKQSNNTSDNLDIKVFLIQTGSRDSS